MVCNFIIAPQVEKGPLPVSRFTQTYVWVSPVGHSSETQLATGVPTDHPKSEPSEAIDFLKVIGTYQWLSASSNCFALNSQNKLVQQLLRGGMRTASHFRPMLVILSSMQCFPPLRVRGQYGLKPLHYSNNIWLITSLCGVRSIKWSSWWAKWQT